MSPVTALSIGCLAFALIVASAKGAERLVGALVLATILLVATVMGSHFVDGSDRISPWMTRHLFGLDADVGGRMSMGTALTLLLISASIAARRRPQVADLAAGFGLLISATALLGYVYSVDDLYATPIFMTMALHTAFTLALLCIASLLLEPGMGWSAVVLSSPTSGRVTRRQLMLLLLPLPFGWLLREATVHRQLGTGSALALLVIITVVPMIVLVVRDGRSQIALDAERKRNATSQAAFAEDLERRLTLKEQQLERASNERLRAEAAMYRTQRVEAISQLTGGIAHDFNNLLAAIGGNLELLLRRLPEGHVARRNAVTAAAAVSKGAKLAGQLLAFSRSQRLVMQPTEIVPALLRARELIGNALGPSIELLLEFSRERVWARTDPDQLELAILNLAVNAREALPSGGRLRIDSSLRTLRLPDAAAERDYVSIRVTDNGVGMTPEVLAQAIEPFFTTRERGKGTGLGLAQVYGFVRQCEGDLHIESEPGSGTTVEMLLPRTEPPTVDVAKPAPDVAGSVRLAANRQRVLVVDDDDAVRAVLVELLDEAGYAVTEARDGPSALARLEELHPHVAVIDFLMPGINGADLARQAQVRRPGLPVVFVSGYADTLALDGIAGATVLRKPFRADELQRAVHDAMESAMS